MEQEDAFSLVEFLIALGIITLLTSSFFQLFLTVQNNFDLILKRRQAFSLARYKLERLSLKDGLNNITNAEFSPTYKQDYSYKLEIRDRRYNLKELRLRVYYQKEELIKLVTII